MGKRLGRWCAVLALLLLCACGQASNGGEEPSTAVELPPEAASLASRAPDADRSEPELPSVAEAEDVSGDTQSGAAQGGTAMRNENPGQYSDGASTLFAPNPADFMECWTFSAGDRTYRQVSNPDQVFAALRQLITPLEGSANGAASAGVSDKGALLVVLPNYTKLTYSLLEEGLEIGGELYPLSGAQREQAAAVFALIAEEEQTATAQWLTWMNPLRVLDVAYATTDGYFRSTDLPRDTQTITSALRGIRVMPGSLQTYNGSFDSDPETDTVFQLVFDSDVLCFVIASGDKLYVETSDRTIGCSYTLYHPLEQDISAIAREYFPDPQPTAP